VTQRNYLPALKEVSNCRIDWFADPNLSNAKYAAEEYGGGNVTRDYSEIIGKVDAAIVAVPNYLHSKVAVDFLMANRDVFCEKPIADNSQNAREMIHASQKSGARLVVNFARRRFESYRLARSLLNQFFTNKIKRIDCREGLSLAGWPFSSPYLLDKKKSGGGVLIDWGAHKLDILNWLFGYDWEFLSYKDDGLGRIESNCELDLRINWNQSLIPCHIELSYLRRLGRKMTVDTELSCLVIDESENEICLRIEGEEDFTMKTRKRPYASYFADQIRSFVDGSRDECLAGEDALNSLLFIEKCYANRTDLGYPWEDRSTQVIRAESRPKILVVGASGFLGTRLVERLVDFGLTVRATFHSPAKATRLARLPIELIECDLLEPDEVTRAVAGCDVIVNCAVGKVRSPKEKDTAMRVYVDGTRNLLEAAKKNGARKFIQISSAAVLGFGRKTDTVNESIGFTPQRSRTFYEKGKISQERVTMEYADSIPTVILRPTLIYGPFSEEWVTNIIEHLTDGRVVLVNNGGVANLVYVDDVVHAIHLAIANDKANGRALIINNDEEAVSWNDYVSRFVEATRIQPNVMRRENLSSLRLKKLMSLCTDSVKACRDNIRSREAMVLLAKIPLVAIVGSKLVKGAKRKRIEESLSSTSGDLANMRKLLTKYETISSATYENLTCRAVFSSAQAKSILGWAPKTRFTDGIRRTLIWAEWVGLIDND